MYENVWQAPNELMNCLKCGALLPFGQHNTEHNEKMADIITYIFTFREKFFRMSIFFFLEKTRRIKEKYNNFKQNLNKVKIKNKLH